MQCREHLETYLQERRIPFQLMHHPRALSAQEVAASEHVSGHRVAKTVIAWADEHLIMLVLPAPLWVDFNQVREALGARVVRLANEQEFSALFADCEPGAMPPFGNLYGLPTYIDPHLSEEKEIIFPAGTHTETIQLKYADFARLVHPLVIPKEYEMAMKRLKQGRSPAHRFSFT
jgi:Ala-tRNA(Pro) deacylase